MSFARSGLYCMGPTAGPRRMWRYDTLDTPDTIDTAGYFNGASAELSVGDWIFSTTWTTAIGAGGTIGATAADTCAIFVVNANASGVVDVANKNPMTTVDSD